ncbi:MAG: amidoligase family protein, partial [Candidatus Brocadiales bacterium]|nr:amidoligase family protein [Candidatus Brocadiales bacterium]
MDLKEIRFGVEIETVKRTRKQVAEAVQSVVGGTIYHVGSPSCFDPYHVTADDGRIWKVMADASLTNTPKRLQAEIVSPILTYEDIPTMQKIARKVRTGIGARISKQCGIHIHTDAAVFTPKALGNLVKIVNKQEDLIVEALGVNHSRLVRYAKKIKQDLVNNIVRRRPQTIEHLNRLWYGYRNHHPSHYDSTRYHGLNLHNVWYRGTVEFRYFEGTLHAGKIKSYIQFCLALSAKAINAKGASAKKRDLNNQSSKYDFRVFLVSLGLIGKEFKTA